MAQKKAVISKEKSEAKDLSSSSKRSALKAVDSVFQNAEGSVFQNSDKEMPKAKHIGDVLKLVRESKGDSVKEIAEVLRISERYLLAIEFLDTESLPEQVYTLGFVRSYAHYLGVDPQKSVTQFKIEVYAATTVVKKLFVPKPVDSAPFPTKKILWGVILALVAFLGIAYVQWGASPESSLDQEISNLLKPIEPITPVAEDAITAPNFAKVATGVEEKSAQAVDEKAVETVE